MYPYIDKRSGWPDLWIFLEEGVCISMTEICGDQADTFTAEEFVSCYPDICKMAINNKKYKESINDGK